MLVQGKPQAEVQNQKHKLASSYTALYDEFASRDLRTVGNYQLGDLIGKGSFGKVYLARHKLTNGSKVVLKSSKKDDSNLAREIHHHRQFIHPHIARLYEVIVTEDLVWLVLEYCPGDELYHYLTQHGSLEPPMVQRIFTQIIGAVSYVHSKSCVHRDLKLENILLDKNRNVKLVDFGFTREYEGKSNCLQTWCGTVCYAAPEMLKGEKYAGEKVDVWSLGIILYALLCGELPFDDDNENETKMKILKEEPKYPDSMPTSAKDLINILLSKRPLLRPPLADILTNPWLAEHAPQQQAILKVQQPAPFTTPLEKDTLQRMRSAGVNIDLVIENVLSQRCDGLAGWWALLIEKEERKAKRREKKRRERDPEGRASRRISAASTRLERLAPTIKETDEEGSGVVNGTPRRGRDASRSGASQTLDLVPEVSSAKKLPASRRVPSNRAVRATSGSRRRSQLGPRDYSKRNSALSIIATNPDLLVPEPPPKKRKRRIQQPFMHQLASIKHWFKESAKRAKSPNPPPNTATEPPDTIQRPQNTNLLHIYSGTEVPQSSVVPSIPKIHSRTNLPNRPRIMTTSSNGSGQRGGSSPSPITPTASYRRSTGSNLRGRKSTSSSVSSVRSMHGHRQSHSVASSASSNSVASPSLGVATNSAHTRRVSPHNSILKVLPKTPTPGSPQETRGLQPPPKPLALTDSNSAFTGLGPPSPGLAFARRKRTPFKGPALGPGSARRRRDGRSSSDPQRTSLISNRSGKIIEEEEEDEDEDAVAEDDDDVEEVDAFSPVAEPDEAVETFPADVHDLAHTPGAEATRESTPQLEETLKALERPPELRFKR